MEQTNGFCHLTQLEYIVETNASTYAMLVQAIAVVNRSLNLGHMLLGGPVNHWTSDCRAN